MGSPLCHYPDGQLSDEAAVEILNFLQVFTLDFEIRHGDQISRYSLLR